MKRPRISIRLDENQNQILNELSLAMHTPISLLVRAIILDFITRNEDVLERIVTGQTIIDYKKLMGNEYQDKDND